jgi:glutathione synthase/RimK-type ligase-like ATP-grasp enzyme
MQEKHLVYPSVVKPDIGCRGVGVQIVRDTDELLSYLKGFPLGGRAMIQELVPQEGEAGIFWLDLGS